MLEDFRVSEALAGASRHLGKGLDCAAARAAWDAAIYALAGPELSRRVPDARVLKALEVFRGLPEKRISAGELAKAVALSESRLSHLFQRDLGLPIRRYLLWLKILEAARFVRDPRVNATRAALAAGFTDSAHLTRSCRQLLGISPSMLFNNRGFVSVFVCD